MARGIFAFTVMMVLFARVVTVAQTTGPVRAENARLGEQIVRLPEGNDQVTIELSRAGEFLLVRGVIDGQEIGHLVVDTGASGLLVDPVIADKLKLPVIVAASMNTPGGVVPVAVRRCEKLELGQVVVDRPLVYVSEMAAMKQLLGFPIAGIVGGDVLGALPFTIDFRDDTLTIQAREHFKPPATQPHAIRMVRATPFVRGAVEGRTGWFVIDTGAIGRLDLDAMFTVLHRDLIDNKALMPGMSFSLGGKGSDFETSLSLARFFDREWRDLKVSFQEGSSKTGTFTEVSAAGVIGIRMFANARLTANYENAEIWVEWRDDVEPLEAYLKRLRDRAGRDVVKTTALMMAAHAGRADAVRALLAESADANAEDNYAFTAVMFAADAKSAECVKLLLEHKADVNHEAVIMSLTPLHRAAEAGSADVLEVLLDAGAKVDALTTATQTPLLRAVQRGSADCARVLLAHGANPSVADKAGNLPLIAAARQGNLEIITLLLDHKANIEARSGDNESALVAAAYARKPEAVKLLLSRGASPAAPALHAAAAGNDADCIAHLLSAGADITAKDHAGRTPLEVAARQGGSRAIRALLEKLPATQPAADGSRLRQN